MMIDDDVIKNKKGKLDLRKAQQFKSIYISINIKILNVLILTNLMMMMMMKMMMQQVVMVIN